VTVPISTDPRELAVKACLAAEAGEREAAQTLALVALALALTQRELRVEVRGDVNAWPPPT
jgi:hypothetical protein